MKSKQLVLFGPPGAGVKVQAIALAKRWQVPDVSMDELLRQAIAAGSILGTEAHSFLEKGEQIPNVLLMGLLRRRFEQPDVVLKGWVLAGFPRTVAQAEAFDELLLKFEQPAANAAYLKATTGILINRLLAEKGPEDTVNTVRGRLTRYQEEINPVIEYYQQRSRLSLINGNQSEAEILNMLFQLGHEETGAARFVKDEAELDALLTKELVLVVDCIASWCGPCKQVTPLVDKLAEEMGDRATVVKLDFDNNRQVAKRFGLKGMPSVMFFKGGNLIETLTGVKSYENYRDVVAGLL
ncbi:MAG: nucleoside monophosphate kinase [Phormidesmis sp.]